MNNYLKVHFHKGTKIMGQTLCGRLVDFYQIQGNTDKKVNCKNCFKIKVDKNLK